MPNILILGGGAALLKRHLPPTSALCRPFILDDVCLNAKGYERLLNHWKAVYAPADMNAPWDGRFAQALHELPAIGHVLDLLYSADAKLREDTAKALINTGALQRIQINLEHNTEEEQLGLEKEENRPAA